MEDLVLRIWDMLPPWAALVLTILMAAHPVASIIVALTPTPMDDNILGKAYKILEWVSLTVGKAKQKPGGAP